MSTIITLTTHIAAPVDRCFYLSLSVDLHREGMKHTAEKAIAGTTSGILKAGETVTWEAKHLLLTRRMTTRISNYQAPFYFVSEMVNGPFKKIHHQHIFKENGIHTIMTDIFEFVAPFGMIGKIAERLFLAKYMRRLLEKRNRHIRLTAQSDEWKKYMTSSYPAMDSVK